MSKKLNLATLNKKMFELSKREAQKVRGAADTCEDRCKPPAGYPGSNEIFKLGGTKIVNDPPPA